MCSVSWWRAVCEPFWGSFNKTLWSLDWKTSERCSLCKSVITNTFLKSVMATLHYFWPVHLYWNRKKILGRGIKWISKIWKEFCILFSAFEEKVTKPICHKSLEIFSRNTAGSKFSIWHDCFNMWQDCFRAKISLIIQKKMKIKKKLSQE